MPLFRNASLQDQTLQPGPFSPEGRLLEGGGFIEPASRNAYQGVPMAVWVEDIVQCVCKQPKVEADRLTSCERGRHFSDA